mgnify:FL=1
MRCIGLFDYTGVMLKPWLEAGYECHIFDIQHPPGKTIRDDGMILWGVDLSTAPVILVNDVVFLSCSPPCSDLSVSGARWMKNKGLRALQQAIGFFATCTEIAEALNCRYLIENPVSTIATYWRHSDYKFHPSWYAGYAGEQDNYTKETHLWTGGGFIMPDRKAFGGLFDGPDRNYIHHQSPGPERANIRSAAPEGFAKAVFLANKA